MKVSVIIPAYNEEQYISRCIESLLAQKVPADEIIVVNNNSSDKTVNIAKKYPVRVVNEKVQGMIHARNRGFNLAKYEIIARTDADTIIPPLWIKKIKTRFKDQKLVGLSGPAEFYDLSKVIENTYWSPKKVWLNGIKSYNRIVKQLVKHDCMYGPNMAVRKTAWQKIKRNVCFDDSKVHEDIDLAIHLARVGEIYFDHTLLVSTSVRRWRKPDAYAEYLYRGLRSIQMHKHLNTRQRSKALVKKLFNKSFLQKQMGLSNEH